MILRTDANSLKLLCFRTKLDVCLITRHPTLNIVSKLGEFVCYEGSDDPEFEPPTSTVLNDTDTSEITKNHAHVSDAQDKSKS